MSESIARNPSTNSKAELRKRLLQARSEAAAAGGADPLLAAHLRAALARYAPHTVGFYWPLDGEFDARTIVAEWLAQDVRRQAALPVVAMKGYALEFHAWTPDAPMRVGHHRIPEPEQAQSILPDLLLVPCVGFDDDGFRLGYGGGYYDRTLAAWPDIAKPVTLGIAYEACRTALPREPHDIALDAVVTDAGLFASAHAIERS
ncbi:MULTISPECIES: 5-formyltetrahydrofolate cyclo-ligase [unclassified Trinickia]|uniref:5-formyltetrahydrofolate cyclo-ligase n=1 Tax=unclassified Trinickia TaxID=2638168 RepID=UPI002406C07D|nr:MULTISPECIES: 5-formyltetrahydrofolate cyclo-ligase [unclassified Trinickia]MDG0023674.1 5-formyltetrahydrofolate cyclo-ligase [Trinickia sp. Y13]HVW49721.1 5-formyltetrahydrofolate cyclo-ligase [Trinickia sp.]